MVLAVGATALAQTTPIEWSQEHIRDLKLNGLTCQQIVELEAKGARCPFPTMRDSYAKIAERLRSQRFEVLKTDSVRQEYAKADYYEHGDLPNGLHSGEETPETFTERMLATNVEEMRTCMRQPDTADVIAELNEAILRQSVKLRAAEDSCRKSKKCMARRVDLAAGQEICGYVAAIADAKEGIRVERANPSGVVDLARLHGLGQLLQESQLSLKAAKAEFFRVNKRQFPDSICRELTENESH